MKVGILSEFCLAGSHGSGAQMLRIIDHAHLDAFHVYWSLRPFGPSEPGRRSFLFEDPLYWRPLRLSRLMARLHAAVGLRGWRSDDTLNARLFERVVPPTQTRADVLYAFATSEESARRCLSLIDHFAKPFVLHIMDVQHKSGLDPAAMPAYAELIRRASAVLVINAAIEKPKCVASPSKKWRSCRSARSVYDLPARAVASHRRRRPDACSSPARSTTAWSGYALRKPGRGVLARFPRAELVYTGTQFDAVSRSTLRPHVKNFGFVPEALQNTWRSYAPATSATCPARCRTQLLRPVLDPFAHRRFFHGGPAGGRVRRGGQRRRAVPASGCFVMASSRFRQNAGERGGPAIQAAWLGDEPRRAAEAVLQGPPVFAETHLSSAGVAQTVVAAHLRAACATSLPAATVPAPRG